MALAFTHIGDASSGSGFSSYQVTLTRALAASELGLCAVLTSKGGTPDIPTLSGGGVTWVQVATTLITAQARLTIFRAQGSAPSGTVLTASFAASQSGCLIIVDAVTGARPDIANNGAAAVVQAVTGSVQSTTDYTVTGAALASALNAQWTAYGAAGGQNVPTAQDGGTTLSGVTKGSPPNTLGSGYEVGDNHARFTEGGAANTIQCILLEISQQAALVLGGTVTPTGTLSKRTVKSFAGGVIPTGVLTRLAKRFRSLGGSITPVGALLAGRLLTKALAGAITPTGTLTRQLYKTYYVAIAGAIAPSGSLLARFLGTHYIALSGMIAPVGNLVRSVRHQLLSSTVEASVPLTPSSEAAATLTPTSDQPAILTPTNEIEG